MMNINRYYFDHAAATPVSPDVLAVMAPFWVENYGNPSAIHREGIAARAAIEGSRERIADIIGAPAKGIVFTGSATESIHLALTGAVRSWKDAHPGKTPEVIVSAIEHDAVLEAARSLEKDGAILKMIPVDNRGVVDVKALEPLLAENTVIVSCMLVNNEIGTIQPVSEIARTLRKWRKDHKSVTRDRSLEVEDMYPLLHSDVTQAVNYISINVQRLGVDMLSCNASKIYGPKGVGLLYSHPIAPLHGVVIGGGQEGGRRGGTEAVPLIVGFAEAFARAQETAPSEVLRLSPVRDILRTNIFEVAKAAGVAMIHNGDGAEFVPNSLNVSFIGVDHEYLAILLDDAGFAVSTKSACNMFEAEVSHVLEAMASEDMKERPLSGLRMTLGRDTDVAACEAFVLTLREVLPLAVV